MNTAIDGVEPPYATTNSGKPQGGDAYIFVIGFFCTVVVLMSLTYTSYICKRNYRSSPPPLPSISFSSTAYEDADNRRLIRLSGGLDDDVLMTFPTFLYSDAKGDTATNSASCSICLADYKPADDVVRLLPACGHLYHVSCIDTWLKAHPTCPMCRNNVPLSNGVITSSAELTHC